MTRSRPVRWAAALAVTGMLAGLPALIARLETPGSSGRGLDAPALLQRVQASRNQGYSGYVQSDGGLALPVTTAQFGSLSDLLGGSTTQRIWWRSGTDYRDDVIAFSGEVDTVRQGVTVWSWDYERDRATLAAPSPPTTIRLPRAGDLLPPELGRRLLSQAAGEQVQRLPARRVAGHTAAGLRLRPRTAGSTVDHVDVWADDATGLPLEVQVPGVMDTRFLDVDIAAPDSRLTAFTPPPAARVEAQDPLDIASAVDRFGGARPPDVLAGLAANPGIATVGAARTYGHDVTELVVGSVPGRDAPGLRDALGKAPAAVTGADGSVRLRIGPLSVLLGPAGRRDAAWVLVGTVVPDVLSTALAELPPPAGRRR